MVQETNVAKILRDLAETIERDFPLERPKDCFTESKNGGRDQIERLEPYILQEARLEYKHRRDRAKFVDQDLLGEPAWDILLDALIHRLMRKRVTVTSVCIASSVPPTTALRWINHLVDQGFLERTESLSDKRRAYVSLSTKGWEKMCRYFLNRESIPNGFSEGLNRQTLHTGNGAALANSACRKKILNA